METKYIDFNNKQIARKIKKIEAEVDRKMCLLGIESFGYRINEGGEIICNTQLAGNIPFEKILQNAISKEAACDFALYTQWLDKWDLNIAMKGYISTEQEKFQFKPHVYFVDIMRHFDEKGVDRFLELFPLKERKTVRLEAKFNNKKVQNRIIVEFQKQTFENACLLDKINEDYTKHVFHILEDFSRKIAEI